MPRCRRWRNVSGFWTIRTRFLIFGLLSLIPLVGFNWLLISDNNRTRYEDQLASQTVLSGQITNSLSGYLGSSFRGIESLAANPLIVEPEDLDATSALLANSRVTRPEFVGVFMLNTDGELVSQAGIIDLKVLPAVDSQIDAVLSTGQRNISGRIDLQVDPPVSVFVIMVPITSVSDTSGTVATATPSANTSEPVTPGTTAIITEQGDSPVGTVRGVMGAIIPTDGLAQASLPTTRGRTEVVILTSDQVITGTGDVRGNEQAFLENLKSQDTAFSDEGTDVFRMTSLSGTERSAIISTVPLESINWSVLVTSPVPPSQLSFLWQELLALLLVAALVYLIMAYAFGELTSRSLTDLTESAGRLAQGDYHTPIATGGSGEMGNLRSSLVDLRARTEEVMSIAEERQAERQRQNEQLRELLRRDLRMQEDERRHIAAEIHDAVSPLITGALYQSRALQRSNGSTSHEQLESSLSDVNGLLERASEELHGIIFDLRPPDLDDIGVVAAIEAFVASIQRTGLEARLEVIDEPPPLTPEVRLGIYRIVQEALHNVLRHAGADEAVVRMEYVNQLLRVTIRDNGAGFDPERARRPGSLGLLSMRERAAAIDADFEILSRPGGGTVIIVERRDTGSIMSDELLETILRDRTNGHVEHHEEAVDYTEESLAVEEELGQ
jgi:signal transduction histidine kinase